jgi:hypothetical protein
VGHVEAVRLLLEKGADIRAVDGVSGSLSRGVLELRVQVLFSLQWVGVGMEVWM